MMSFKIPSHILDLWKKDGQEQLIAQVDGSEETAQAPYRFHQSDILCVSSVRADKIPCLLKTMLHECMIQDSTLNNLSWYTRIPSPSNIADAPSRMRLDEIAELFQFEPVLDYVESGSPVHILKYSD